jgi:hypothetical protein
MPSVIDVKNVAMDVLDGLRRLGNMNDVRVVVEGDLALWRNLPSRGADNIEVPSIHWSY